MFWVSVGVGLGISDSFDRPWIDRLRSKMTATERDALPYKSPTSEIQMVNKYIDCTGATRVSAS